jgi:hypothetical protein
MQLASILPPQSSHRKGFMQFTLMMPGAEAHDVVQSQDDIHVIINFPYLTLANLDDGLCRDSTLRNQSQTELRVESQITITILNHDYTTTEPRWQSTINMTQKSSMEQRIFKKRVIAVSDRSSPTHKLKAHVEAVYQNTHREVNQAVYQAVDRKVL